MRIWMDVSIARLIGEGMWANVLIGLAKMPGQM